MKILKILGIAAGIHALALLLIFSNPGCSYSKAAAPESSPISSAPNTDPGSPSTGATVTAPDSVGIRYSPTRPGTAAASSLASQPVTDVTPATTYTVSKGDTLSSIAKKNQINKADLVAANHLKGTSVLHTGQKLIIPAKSGQASSFEPAPAEPAATAKSEPAAEKASMGEGTKHVVRNGETLGAIARKYGVKQGDIAVANNITDPKKIQPGQELVIPAKSGSSGGKQAKGSKAAPADNARGSTSAPTAKSAGAPPPDQDLDSGLKPTNAAEVPVVKIEEPASGPAPKSP